MRGLNTDEFVLTTVPGNMSTLSAASASCKRQHGGGRRPARARMLRRNPNCLQRQHALPKGDRREKRGDRASPLRFSGEPECFFAPRRGRRWRSVVVGFVHGDRALFPISRG